MGSGVRDALHLFSPHILLLQVNLHIVPAYIVLCSLTQRVRGGWRVGSVGDVAIVSHYFVEGFCQHGVESSIDGAVADVDVHNMGDVAVVGSVV